MIVIQEPTVIATDDLPLPMDIQYPTDQVKFLLFSPYR